MELTSNSKVSSVGNGGVGCIEHTVTKFDTLAGVAIKYGVEVADIKKMNGLTTDLQMFALKSLKIPLPGRHPPSSVISNGYHTQGQTSAEVTSSRRYSDSFSPIRSLRLSSSPQRNISSSISSLREYYRLPPINQKGVTKSFEMTQTNTPLGLHRKSKSENNGFSKICKTGNVPVPNDKGAGSNKSIEKLVRRRKSEVDLNNRSPEDLAVLQSKIANHTTTEPESGAHNMVPLGSSESSMGQVFSGVRKSSSAPTFLQSETNNNNCYNNSPASSSIWPMSILNFTADLQSMSIAAITSPLFDGLSKPPSGRKSKAARD
ncbi:putative LysM domain-containing protein [Helianthus annuus]|nr:putative LysM domain-containing protein [Helianthus annuus]